MNGVVVVVGNSGGIGLGVFGLVFLCIFGFGYFQFQLFF